MDIKATDGNFKVINIVYESEDFAIAYGNFRDEGKYIGMRWNHTKKGYPVSKRGSPQWFMLKKGFEMPILTHLLNLKKSKASTVEEIIEEIIEEIKK